jgi:C4-dicarboxylate transporter DctM subunit
MSPLAISGLLFAFLVSGLPYFIAIGMLALVLFHQDGLPLNDLARAFGQGIGNDTALAIPFFAITAIFMQQCGLAKLLSRSIGNLFCNLRGGLAAGCVPAVMLLAVATGGSFTAALAIGAVMVPAMLAAKTERSFVTGVLGGSGAVGALLPPGLALIAYGIISGTPLPQLFLAGLIPALLLAALMLTHIIWHGSGKADRVEFAGDEGNSSLLPALPLIIFIPTGLYTGFLTPAQTAAISALLSILLCLFVYRKCRLAELPRLFSDGLRCGAGILFIIGSAAVYSQWLYSSGTAADLAIYFADGEMTGWRFLLIAAMVLLILGMFLDVVTVILITLPLALPLLTALDISTAQFAVIMMITLELAMLTPPLGLNLFILSSVTGAPVGEAVKGTLPVFLILLVLLGLVIFIPELSLWLPDLVYEGPDAGV